MSWFFVYLISKNQNGRMFINCGTGKDEKK